MPQISKNMQKGQALLEVAISVGIAIILVAAIAITTVIGLKNSQFAKNQAQATKLAQEGIERVRSVRNRDYVVCIPGPPAISKWSDVWSYPFGRISTGCTTTCTYILKNNPPDQCSQTATQSPFWIKQAISTTETETLLGNFRRQILIEDTDVPSQKKVTSRVSWSDFSGDHKSELVTILSRNN